jgi:predicted transcriptional regulator
MAKVKLDSKAVDVLNKMNEGFELTAIRTYVVIQKKKEVVKVPFNLYNSLLNMGAISKVEKSLSCNLYEITEKGKSIINKA